MNVRQAEPAELGDQAVRDDIRERFDENLFVTAGAGTGKTRSIVARVVNAVCCRMTDPGRIAVMTFTEKASAELLFRIRQSLEAKKQGMAARLPEMFVGTIHSFCLSLLREQPLESGIDPGIGIMTQDEASDVQDRIGRDLVREHLAKHPDHRFTELEYDPYSAVSFFLELHQFRELDPVDPAVPPGSFLGRYGLLMDGIPDLIESNQTTDPAFMPQVEKLYRSWSALAAGGSEEAAIEFAAGMDVPDGSRKTWSSVKWNGSNAKSILSHIEDITKEVRTAARERIAGDLYRKEYRGLYLAFADRYREWKKAHSRLDFNDIIIMTRDLLAKNRDARAYFRERFDLLVVDEFQDTDPVMAEILARLCSADDRACPWEESVLTPGKLTVVGDPKQSIYRFRRADISIFLAFRRMFEERGQGRVLSIATNFRSRRSLIGTFNHVFPPLFDVPGEDDRQTVYDPVLPGPSSGRSRVLRRLLPGCCCSSSTSMMSPPAIRYTGATGRRRRCSPNI